MKRRDFIRFAAFTTVAAVVPMVALSRPDQFTFEDLIKVRDLMDANAIPEPYYALVPPKVMADLFPEKLLTGQTHQYEGITFIEHRT